MFVLALLLVPAACAPATAPHAQSAGESARSDVAAELLRLSGLEQQLAFTSSSMRAQLARQQGNVPPQQVYAFQRALAEFSPDVLQLIALARLQSRIDPAGAAAALDWLRSPTGRRMTGLEEASATLDADAAQRLAAAPGGAETPLTRVIAIDRLNRASGAEEFGADVAIAIGLASAAGASPSEPTPEQLAALRAALETQRPVILENARASASTASLSTYRSASDAELAEYAGFLESEPGQWYAHAMSDALLHALATATQNFVRALRGGH